MTVLPYVTLISCAERRISMLKPKPRATVCCPSCGSSLEGEFDGSSVNIKEGEMSVTVRCEGCDGYLSLTVGPIPPDGRKVDVKLKERCL